MCIEMYQGGEGRRETTWFVRERKMRAQGPFIKYVTLEGGGDPRRCVSL